MALVALGRAAKARGAPFTPQSLPGTLELILDSKKEATFYSNEGLTTVTADGSSIVRWAASPGSYLPHAQRLGGVRNPLLIRIESGISVGESNNNQQHVQATMASRTTTAFTVYRVVRLTANQLSFDFSLTASNQGSPSFSLRSVEGEQTRADGLATLNTCARPAMWTTDWHVDAFTYAGTTGVRTFCDGAEIGPSTNVAPGAEAGPASVTQTAWSIGHVLGQAARIRVAACYCYHNSTHTPTQVRQMTDWLRMRFAELVGNGADNAVIFTGASNMMDTSNVGYGNGIPAKCLAASALWTRSWSFSRPSITTALATSRISEELGQVLSRRTGRTVVCHYAGGNDGAGTGLTSAQIMANLEAMADAVHAYGSHTRFLAVTYLPRTSFNNTTRGEVNVLMRADANNKFDDLADIAANTTIGDDADNADSTYYHADGIHLKEAGTAIAAPIVGARIDALLA